MRTPVVVVTGVDPDAMDTVMLGLSWDLPNAVAVRHRIDPVTQVLTRVVSDSTGVLERIETTLEHACVGCALREDIVPTLERLAGAGRWDTVVACLPTSSEATQLASMLTYDAKLARRLRLCRVVTALGGDRPVDELLSDALLSDVGRHTSADDERALGEVACAQVETADTLVLAGTPDPGSLAFVKALARPGADVVVGADQLDGPGLVTERHRHAEAAAWRLPVSGGPVPPLAPGPAWRLELCSPRAFHPDRLVDQVESLGTGQHRSRGCFWVPTRPGVLQEWSGAGRQLSIGSHCDWGRRTPLTRLVMTGLGTPPPGLTEAFEAMLLTPAEARLDRRTWRVSDDGLEPWLGRIDHAA